LENHKSTTCERSYFSNPSILYISSFFAVSFIVIDLHTHSIFSDGELIPYELVRRAIAKGYRAIAITDHVDSSNMDFVIPRIVKAIDKLRTYVSIEVIPGAEITHAPPRMIPDLVKEARNLGALIVVVHGETIVEPVVEGTNRAAIEAGADLLAHPGLIKTEDILFAKEMGTMLEITSRKGHSLSNGYVAKEASKFGVSLSINTDSHSPDDLITVEMARNILIAAGIDENRLEQVFENSKRFVEKISRRL
ncbi:MAG: histidinol phosphate phosphatase domain-containing protein, partial [Thermodesulfovibrionales bacterium]